MHPADRYPLSEFETNGVAVVRAFMSVDQRAALVESAAAVVAAWDPSSHASVFSTDEQTRTSDEVFLASGDRIECFLEDGVLAPDGSLLVDKERAVNKIGHALHDLEPAFEAASHTTELAAVARAVGMAEPKLVQSMFITKGPGTGGAVDTHIDHTFLWTEPRSVVGFWFALDDADVDNGCLWVLPGGHRSQAVRRRFHRDGDAGTAFDVFDDEPYPLDGFVPIEVEAGTLVVLHGLLPHRSEPNTSDRPRRAYTLHAVESGATWHPDNWLRRGDLADRGFA